MTPEQLGALERLAKLKEQGLLTEQELETAKASVLYGATPPPAPVQPTSQPEQPTPPPAATPVPVTSVEAPPRSDSAGKVIVIAGAAIAAMILIVRLASGPNRSTSGVAAPDTAALPAALDTTTTPAPPPGPPPTKWSYYDREDAMDGKYFTASIDADEFLNFDFPYSGGSTATLTIRKRRGSLNVMLRVSKGQFHGSYDGGTVRVKFDDRPTETYSFSEASDGSSDVIFLNSEKRLVAKMKKAKRMIVEAEFYNNGLQKMTFQTEGLKWNH